MKVFEARTAKMKKALERWVPSIIGKKSVCLVWSYKQRGGGVKNHSRGNTGWGKPWLFWDQLLQEGVNK